MKIRHPLFSTFCLICFLLTSSTIRSQDYITKSDSLYSDYLNELREIQVIFPAKFDSTSKERYHVLYILDGEWNTSLSKTVYNFLEYAQFIPTNMMMVSIPNRYESEINFRERDFTPTHVENYNISGGANNFLLFLKEELVPFVNNKYPTKVENNILYGTSWGGLFAIYAYLYEPTLFKSYLTVEPVLKWDNGYLNKLAPEKLEKLKESKNTLWISSRDGKDFHDMGIADFDSLLTVKSPESLLWKVKPYPNETHFSAIWKGIYDGLKFTYSISSTGGKIVNRANTINLDR